ncbi:MAG: ATP-binding cassette domain-containing protein [Oscillospiraceae bacterium]|jgi:ATP-binding cassette subfamily F protein 3
MLVTLENINKFYSGRQILKNVSLTVEDNERIGLIGINGCGKSTLLKILIGMEAFDNISGVSGSISVSGKATIGFLQQNSGLERENSIQAEMEGAFLRQYEIQNKLRQLEAQMADEATLSDADKFSGISAEYSKLSSFFEANDGYLIDVKINTVLNGMGFGDIDRSRLISTLSGGEKTRLAMAKLLLESPSLLILDEPTNHLDFKTLLWLEEYLGSYRGALLIVSHDRYFLDKLCTRICEIENGILTSFKGDYSAYLFQKEMLVQCRLKEYEQQRDQISRLQEYIDRNKVRASTANMAKSRQAALDRIEPVEKPQSYVKPPKIKLEYDVIPPKEILTVKGLEVSAGEGDGFKLMVRSLDFEVRRGEKVALIGPNGIGKSTILKLILGKFPKNKGTVEWASNVKISYFEQENLHLNFNNTVLEELHRRYPRETEQSIRTHLGKVLMTGENVFKPVGVVSGGERAKLCFAILMKERANVLVLDEPTNHLDLNTKEVLEDALFTFDGTVIFVSHDRYLLNRIATRIIEIGEDTAVEYKGNYDFYSRKKQEEEFLYQKQLEEEKLRFQNELSDEKNIKVYKTRELRSLEASRKSRVRELERLIEVHENELSVLERDILMPEVYSDYEMMTEKCRKLDEIKAFCAQLYDEWAELFEQY